MPAVRTGSRFPVIPRGVVLFGICVGVVALAFALRIWAIDWGRPYEYHPDENAIYGPVLNMLLRHDPNPHNFQYPSLLTNSTALAFAAVHLVLGWPLQANALPSGANGSDLLPALFPYLVVGRSVVVGYGVVSCLLVVFALRQLDLGLVPSGVGGLALAVAPLAVSNAHFLTTDVPSSAGCALTALGVAGMVRRQRPIDATIAGVGVGLAASGKYNAALIVVMPLVALALRHLTGKRARRDAIAVVLTALVAFALTSPFFLLDPTSSLPWIQFQVQQYQGGHLGAQGSNNVVWYTWTLISHGWGFGLSALSGLGIIFGCTSRRHRGFCWAALCFVVTYLVVIGLPPTRFDRNLLPLFPPLAVLAGIGAEAASEWGRLRVSHRGTAFGRRLLGGVSVVVLAAALAPPLATDVGADRVLGQEDTRSIAFDLATRRLPANARLVREWYTPQLEWTTMTTESVNSLSAHSVAWYKAKGYDYLVASSDMYGRYFTDPAAPPATVATYREIFALPEVFEVKAGTGQEGPEVRVYQLRP